MEGLAEPIAEEQKEQIFFDAVEDFKMLSAEMAHYNRLKRGDAEKSYKYLTDAVEQFLERQRKKNNRQQMVDSLQSGGKLPAAAAAGSPEAEGEDKDKEKEKREAKKAARKDQRAAAAAAKAAAAEEGGTRRSVRRLRIGTMSSRGRSRWLSVKSTRSRAGPCPRRRSSPTPCARCECTSPQHGPCR